MFSIIFISVIYNMYLVNYVTSKELIHNQQLNLIMDEVVVDSLNVAFYDTSKAGEPMVDKEELKDNILSEAAIGLLGSVDAEAKKIIDSRILFVIYMDRQGYYCYSDGKWNDMVNYSSDIHEEIVHQITSKIDDMFENRYKTLIPYNNGEDYKNSIYKYSCLVFYEQFNKYYCFSGAKINLLD